MKYTRNLWLLSVLTCLFGCGGGQSTQPQPASFNDQPITEISESIEIDGGGIKGPLAHAVVRIYNLNLDHPNLFDSNNVVTSGNTDSNAAIQNLRLPAGTSLPLVLEVDGTNSIDLVTGKPPVIKQLLTVITASQIQKRLPIYATPLSTMSFLVARSIANNQNNTNESFTNTLNLANNIVLSTFNFGLSSRGLDTFLTPPVITNQSTNVSQQQLVSDFRTANEAFAAVIYNATNNLQNRNNQINTSHLMEQLAEDLRSDLIINNRANGLSLSPTIQLGLLTANTDNLNIPNSDIKVRNTAELLEEELGIGNSNSNFLINGYISPVSSAVLNADIDNDGIVNFLDNDNNSRQTTSDNSNNRSPFASVPVLSGQMDFPWFESAKSRYSSTEADDAVNWPALHSQATRRITVFSCNDLQVALDDARPGDIIMVDAGRYNNCGVTISRDGVANNPIILTSRAKALGQAGEVEFIGGNYFASFINAASHYIIGGFSFLNQSRGAFRTEHGVTDTNSSGSPTYRDGSTDIRITDNHFEGIGRAGGSNEGVILLGVRSHRVRIDHNSLIHNYNNIRFRNDRNAGARESATKDGRVDHNYIGPPATTGFVDGVHYEVSAVQTCCSPVREHEDGITLTFDYNIVEHGHSSGGDDEVIESKSSDMVIRNNIIWSERHDVVVALRQGHRTVVDSNYLVATGITVLGSNHEITSNYIDGMDNLRDGIIMSRWGIRKPSNCGFLDRTGDNLIANNTILGTERFGMRIGDCDFGACRPITNSTIRDNIIRSSSGRLVHYNSNNEAGRTTSCSGDRPGDADGGVNTGIEFIANRFSATGTAIYGSAFNFDALAVAE